MWKQKKVIQIYKLSSETDTVSTLCDSKKDKYSGAVCSTPLRETRLCSKRSLWHDASEGWVNNMRSIAQQILSTWPNAFLFGHRQEFFLLYVVTRHYFYLVYRGIVVFEEHGNLVYTKLENLFLSKNEERGDIINNR